VSKQGIFYNEQESAQTKFIDSFINFVEDQYKYLMAELSVETEIHSNFKSNNCGRNSVLYRKEESYPNDMLIGDEGRFKLQEKLLYEPNKIKRKIIFNDNEREAIEYKQQFVNHRGEEGLDRNFIISMVRENVQQTDVSGVQLRKNCKEEVEKVWNMKSFKKRN